MEKEKLTVSQINAYIKKRMSMDHGLKNIYVKGEISNYKSYPRGHDYFTLKDEDSQLKAVIYNHRKRFLEFVPENGMKVIVKGTIEVYEKNGYYQLKANSITEDGLGHYHILFEKLKNKLKDEGLFDEKYKKEIPKYPKHIGVVTASNGAAVKDIITTIKRRYPLCEILIFPSLVQGKQAAPQITAQIKNAQKYDLDTLIIGRGGGSIEDLWPFNEEIVARAIFECKTPIISAVGHEIDFTIADFVADLRAPTPTAAAELAVPQIKELKNNVNQLTRRANKSMNKIIQDKKINLNNITDKQIIKNPESIYDIKQMHLDHLISNLNNFSKAIISENKNKLKILEKSNIFKNPESIYKLQKNSLESLINSLNYSSKNIISTNKNKLKIIKNNTALKNPKKIYHEKQISLNNYINRIDYSSKKIISDNRNQLEIIKNSKILKNPNEIKIRKQNQLLNEIDKLEILNPLLTLKRGYSIAKSDDKVITSVKDVKTGDEVDIKLNDGIINTKVI
nr:exodeoxyribonuclease VII large subunit [uncultured Methanobrevibacter sp.]